MEIYYRLYRKRTFFNTNKNICTCKRRRLRINTYKNNKAGEEGIIGNATELVSNTSIEYGTGITNKAEGKIKLENANTESSLSIDKDTLSTVVTNDVEIRATLKANNEQYNLYENPRITFELPEAVENITINNVELVYEDELAIQNYYVDEEI